jgi:hypothetical protein
MIANVLVVGPLFAERELRDWLAELRPREFVTDDAAPETAPVTAPQEGEQTAPTEVVPQETVESSVFFAAIKRVLGLS